MAALQIDEVGGVGDNLTVDWLGDDRAVIEIDSPWTGDTETGFGRSAAITLTKDQVRQLVRTLAAWAGDK